MEKLKKVTHVADFQQLARKRVPKMFYEYVDSGSWTQSSYRANEEDLQRLLFKQRVAVNIEQRSIASSFLGQYSAMPIALAPTGLTGMQHADGEILAALAAKNKGVPFTLSTMSICSLEDIAAYTQAPFWFQLYVMRDRAFMEALIERAKAAQCSALVVTLDLQVLGQRHKDIKNGLTTPPKPTLRNILNLATKPYWCAQMRKTSRRTFGNIVGHAKGVSDVSSLAVWTAEQFDPSLCWDDIEWIKERWGGKLILKGIMEPDDALLAVQAGADAIVVSNHGGRQLDGAPSTIAVLSSIVEAVQGQTEIYMDGGVRSGQDVLRALALGADGVMIGRAFLYALGAAGQAGVERCLDLLANELDVTMALCGRRNLDEVDRTVLKNPDLFN